MKNSDNIAKEYLEKLGYSPIKIIQGKSHPENKGLPDFRCSNNRYVEVKKLSNAHQHTQAIIQGNQFEVIKKLTRNGKRVFLMILSPDCKKYDIFEIKHIVGKREMSSLQTRMDKTNVRYPCEMPQMPKEILWHGQKKNGR